MRDTIVVVDDDSLIRGLIAQTLGLEGYNVIEVEDGVALDKALADTPIHLIILDVSLPGDDGFSILRRLRENSHIPVIMLTAKSEVIDRVVGLELGADDYICKPVEMRELVARIRTVLRRFQPTAKDDTGPAQSTDARVFNDFVLDLRQRQLRAPDGAEIRLTSGEFDLLQVLADNPNRPLSRDELLEMTRERDWNPFDRSVDVLIGRLRKKLETDPRAPQMVKTVRGIGYIFATNVSRA